MHQYGDIARMQAQSVGKSRVVNLIDTVDFEKMIAGAERAELLGASLVRPFAYALGVRASEPPAFFSVFEVLPARIAVAQRPFRTFIGDELDLLVGQSRDSAFGAYSSRYF